VPTRPVAFLLVWSVAVTGCNQVARLLTRDTAPETVDVVVVGAGLAGLSTAYRLQQTGMSIVVLEATSHIGGRIRTARYPGKPGAEVGLEELWEGNPALEIAEELGLPVSGHEGSLSSFRQAGVVHSNKPGLGNREFVRSFLSPEEFAAFTRWDD
jgi:monoamine oxidase